MQVAGLLYAQRMSGLDRGIALRRRFPRPRPSLLLLQIHLRPPAPRLLLPPHKQPCRNHMLWVQLHFDSFKSPRKKHIFEVGVSLECLGHGTRDRIVERCKAPPSALARSCREVVGGQSATCQCQCWSKRASLLPAAARGARAQKKSRISLKLTQNLSCNKIDSFAHLGQTELHASN